MTTDKAADEVLLSVYCGEMSINEGVIWGLERGLPFAAVPPDAVKKFRAAVWGIEQAIGWIAWRAEDGAARTSLLLAYWGDLLSSATPENGQRESVADAKTALWNALIDGVVTASGRRVPVENIPQHQLIRGDIPASDFIDLEWKSSGLSRSILLRDMVWVDVRVSAAKVKGLWPAVDRDPEHPALTDVAHHPQGGSKLGTVIEALLDLYPHRPASKNRLHLLEKIKEKVGYEVSLATLDRAWKEAWK